MAKLGDKFLVDFTGGVRNDRSDYTKNSNEIDSVLNFDLDEVGRARKRRGSHQFGDTSASNIVNSFYWEFNTLGSSPTTFHLVANDASTSLIDSIVGNRLTVAAEVGDTVLTLAGVGLFAAAGTVEIEGDLVAYTGKAGATLTGVTGITSNHAAGTAVHQLSALSGTSVNGEAGVYFATLNNLLFINGRVGSSTFNGTTMTAVSDADEPAGLFATTYRQRIYVAGSGATDGAGTRNGSRIRVSFSDPGDPTSWTLANFFDVEDNTGEAITALHASPSDELLIFKQNSVHAYNEATLKQRSEFVGAYNHFVKQEIDGLIYTFCPAGVYVTNGSSFQKISDPIEDYLKDFRPVLDQTVFRVVTNTFAATFDKKYILYIGDIESVESADDIALVYDTERQTWSVYQGLTNFQSLRGFRAFKYGNAKQSFEGLFGGDDSGKYYRFFSKKYIDDGGTSRFIDDGDIFWDLISDTGTIVSCSKTTKFYDFGFASLKRVRYVRALTEGLGFNLSIRIEDERGQKSDWIPLGEVDKLNKRFTIPDKYTKCYRIAARVTHADQKAAPVFNGYAFEGLELLDDKR